MVPDGLLRRRLAWSLQLYRYVHDITQGRLAERLGYRTDNYLSEIEQQRRNPTLGTVERFADVLGLDPADLQQPAPPETSERGRRVTIAIDSEADDVLVHLLRAMAELGIVVSFRVLDGRVLEGVPVVVTNEQVLCTSWIGELGRPSDETFVVQVAEITTVRVR